MLKLANWPKEQLTGGVDVDSVFSGVMAPLETDFQTSISARRLLTPAVFEPGSIHATEYTGVEYYADLQRNLKLEDLERIEGLEKSLNEEKLVAKFSLDTHEMEIKDGVIEVFEKESLTPEKSVVAKISETVKPADGLTPDQRKQRAIDIAAQKRAARQAQRNAKNVSPESLVDDFISEPQIPIDLIDDQTRSFADDAMSAIDSLSGAVEDIAGDVVDDTGIAYTAVDNSFDSLGAEAFEDLSSVYPKVSAKITSAAKSGKDLAGIVAKSASKSRSSGSFSSARAVAESVSGYTNSMSPNQLKMAALGLTVGGLGAGYANRRRKRR